MIVQKRRQDGFTIVRVEGIIKLGESAEFLADTLKRILETDEGDVMIDLEAINTIDSTGIGELVGYLGRFRNRDRKMILVRASERIKKLLALGKLDRLFSMYDDLDAAIANES